MPAYYVPGLLAGNGTTILAPTSRGTNGQALFTDGAGGTSWLDVVTATRDSLGLDVDDAVTFGSITAGAATFSGNVTARNSPNGSGFLLLDSQNQNAFKITCISSAADQDVYITSAKNIWFKPGSMRDGYGTIGFNLNGASSLSDFIIGNDHNNNNLTGTYSTYFKVDVSGNITGTHIQNLGSVDSPTFTGMSTHNALTPTEIQVHSTHTDASNYERLSIKGVTGGNFVIATEAAGTGVLRNLTLGNGFSSTWVDGTLRCLNGMFLYQEGSTSSIRHQFNTDGTVYMKNAVIVPGSNGNSSTSDGLTINLKSAGFFRVVSDTSIIPAGGVTTHFIVDGNTGRCRAGSGVGMWSTNPPDTQPAATSDLKDVLVSYGLMADGGASPLDLDGGAITAGAATLSSTVTMSGLPTVDPVVAGQLWNDAGTLKVSAG